MLVDELQTSGITLKHIDIGGGLGIPYNNEEVPTPEQYLGSVKQRLKATGHENLSLVVEPGRSIAGEAGIMLTRIELIKKTDHKNFAVVDGAMNDLLRPAIYSAWHTIEPAQSSDADVEIYDVVGPVCETGDFLGKTRELSIKEGDLLAVRSAGAYGFVMSSNYNSRNRAAEVMVDGDQAHLIRRRETITEQFASERILPE